VVPPAFIITPSPLGEGWGEVTHGNNLGLRYNGRSRLSYDCAFLARPYESNIPFNSAFDPA